MPSCKYTPGRITLMTFPETSAAGIWYGAQNGLDFLSRLTCAYNPHPERRDVILDQPLEQGLLRVDTEHSEATTLSARVSADTWTTWQWTRGRLHTLSSAVKTKAEYPTRVAITAQLLMRARGTGRGKESGHFPLERASTLVWEWEKRGDNTRDGKRREGMRERVKGVRD